MFTFDEMIESIGKSSSELERMIEEIKKQEDSLKKKTEILYKAEAIRRHDALLEHKDLLLSVVPHRFINCSDENPCNGFESKEVSKCWKCMLIDYFSGKYSSDSFFIELRPDFTRLK